MRLLVVIGALAMLCGSLHVQPVHRCRRSMRGRLGRHFVTMSDSDSESGLFGPNGLFGNNRNTPEAIENQRAWAREQMALEVPDATLEGSSITDRDDLIQQYIASEQEKFGRTLDLATAEAEVDEWLLKQATYAPAKTSGADIAIAAAVFALAFGSGIYFTSKGS